jgi:multiple sugar transport system permease protein
MACFIAYPVISNLILSFQNVTVMTLTRKNNPFVGLENYINLFRDEILVNSIWNTLFFTICCLVFQFIIGFVLALFFNINFSFSKPIRGLIMIGWMIPITVTSLMFRFIFASSIGVLNQLLMLLHIIREPIIWLAMPDTAKFALITANIWVGIPFNMLLLATGLTTISKELYESASIDGSGRIQSFCYITVPLLKPTMKSVLILGFIYTFKVFDIVYVMTGGGPVNATHLLSTYSYKLSFELFRYSEGAAVANILFLILFFVNLLYLKYSYSDEKTSPHKG